MSNHSALVTELRPGRRTLPTELVQDAGFLLVVEASSHQHACECTERIDFDMLFVEVEHARDPRFTLIHHVRQDRERNVQIDTGDRVRSTQHLGDENVQRMVLAGHKAVVRYVQRLESYGIDWRTT